MGQVWYCLIDGKEHGPFEAARLRVLAERRQLLPTHHVRLSESAAWTVAAKVKGLFVEQAKRTDYDPGGALEPRRWSIKSNEREFGPFTDAQVRQLAIKGELKALHLVRVIGKSEWHTAQSIQGLFDGATTSATAPVAAPFVQPTDGTPTELKFACGACGRVLRCKSALAGKSFHCPACKGPVTAPIRKASPAPAPPAARPTVEPTEEPIVVQAKRVGAQVAEKIVGLGVWKFLGGLKPIGGSPEKIDYRPPMDCIRFYGSGQIVDLGRGPIESPLVYATGQQFARVCDASLIEVPLPASSSSHGAGPLPYWPTYHEASPRQRAKYLDWIYSGRKDADTELGYVFVFFYGLERRILVDGEDHVLVIEELLRLLSIYRQSNSFQKYATELLWLAVYLTADRDGISPSLLSRAIDSAGRWSDDSLRYCLGYFGLRAVSLPLKAAAVLTERDERSVNSVVIKRHPGKFDALFANRFAENYPDGFTLPTKYRERKIYYRPASGTLLAARNPLPQIAARTAPSWNLSVRHFAALSTYWNECVDELKNYDRISRRATSAALTGELYESLPPELQSGDHPELTAWQKVIAGGVDESGWPVISISELAQIKKLARRPKLTKKQCTELLATADALGIAVEPDARLTGKNYLWDERVVLFHDDGPPIEAGAAYRFRSAALLLQLGLSIATADEVLEEEELSSIAGRLEREFDLGPRLTKRLEGLKHLLISSGQTETSVTAAVRKALPVAERTMIGGFLVTIAAADRVICEKERKVLKKAFRSLGIPAQELSKLLAPYDAAAAAANVAEIDGATPIDAPVLDLELIRAIREETRQVQELLHAVLTPTDIAEEEIEGSEQTLAAGEEPAPINVAAMPAVPQPFAHTIDRDIETPGDNLRLKNVPERYRAFCRLAVAKSTWRRDDLSQLARESGLMLNAACEALNEWSTDEIGDWLLEEVDDQIVVHKHLLEIS